MVGLKVLFFVFFMLLRSFSIAASILLLEATGFASLSLTPTRVDLNSSKKTQSVLLMNDTNETVTYRLGFAYRTMKPSGDTEISTPEEEKLMKPIEQMVLFSPKQVTLQPKQLQTVKFTYRNVPTATLDEYAAYVTFQEQDNSPKIPQLSDQPEDGGVAIKVKALFKISIPIFVSTATASTQHTTDIANLKIDKELNVLNFDINNTGKYSITGRAVAKFFNGKKLLGEFEQKNISLPNPLKSRSIVLQYDEIKFQETDATSVEVTYLPPEGEKSYAIGKATLDLKK